jgi:hypothetical protein
MFCAQRRRLFWGPLVAFCFVSCFWGAVVALDLVAILSEVGRHIHMTSGVAWIPHTTWLESVLPISCRKGAFGVSRKSALPQVTGAFVVVKMVGVNRF